VVALQGEKKKAARGGLSATGQRLKKKKHSSGWIRELELKKNGQSEQLEGTTARVGGRRVQRTRGMAKKPGGQWFWAGEGSRGVDGI